MFKIPKWEDDVPKSNITFGKTNKATTTKSESRSVNNKSTKKQEKIVKSPNKAQKHDKKTLFTKNKNNLKTKNTKSFDKSNGFKPKVVQNKKFSGNAKVSVDRPPSLLNKKKRLRKRKLNEAPPTDSVKPAKIKKIISEDSDLDEDSNVNNVLTETFTSKVEKKKDKLKAVLKLESNRNQINVSGNNLRQRMLERLKAAQFRFLNEKLYTTSGSEAQQLFESDPQAFRTYHQGYQLQLKKWPVNPLDLIVKRISKMPLSHLIADMGCGEAALASRVKQSVRSFDLVSTSPAVEACDMSRTPLQAASVSAVVYCLALMGTELTKYLLEANRVLKEGGHLLIAEVESRFDKVETFTDGVQRLGFKLVKVDKSHTVFYFMEFVKVRDPPVKKAKLPALTLKPCLYKRR